MILINISTDQSVTISWIVRTWVTTHDASTHCKLLFPRTFNPGVTLAGLGCNWVYQQWSHFWQGGLSIHPPAWLAAISTVAFICVQANLILIRECHAWLAPFAQNQNYWAEQKCKKNWHQNCKHSPPFQSHSTAMALKQRQKLNWIWLNSQNKLSREFEMQTM